VAVACGVVVVVVVVVAGDGPAWAVGVGLLILGELLIFGELGSSPRA